VQPTVQEYLVTFDKLSLHPEILKAIVECGYTTPTPIQNEAIPAALEGHDLMASAQTGTGKTAAFILPALQRLTTPSAGKSRGPRVLVLTPTRELASQVNEAASKYGRHLRFTTASILGGMPYPAQNRALSKPMDIMVATPGRLMDHMERGRVDFSRLEILVLDEADRMLDMGFISAVETIAAATPSTRQTLLFSATLEGNIAKLAQRLLKNPQRIQIASAQARHENIEQRLHHTDDDGHKQRMLAHLLIDDSVDKTIIFTATKRGADKLARTLQVNGHKVAALHGDMNQSARNRVIHQLRGGTVRVLVATDVAARGIDVNGVSHVINFDLPRSAEDYVHRIGRTGRAGANGTAISFAAPDETRLLRDIERYTGHSIPAHVVPGMEPKIAPRRGGSGPRGQGKRKPFGGRPNHANSRSEPGAQAKRKPHTGHPSAGRDAGKFGQRVNASPDNRRPDAGGQNRKSAPRRPRSDRPSVG
jgi:superfamily II DNA/RNA helicase